MPDTDYALFAAAEDFGGDTALCAPVQWTHAELRERCLERAADFASEGVLRAVSDEDPIRCIVDYLASIASGRVAALEAWTWPAAARALRFETLEAWCPALRPSGERVPARAPVDVVFTSGSSGQPRAVVHCAENYAESADGAQERIRFGPGNTWLLSLPLHHVGGISIVWRALRSGGAIAPRLASERGSDGLAAALVRSAPTHVSLVAKQLRDLLSTEDDACRRALAATEALLVGGGPVPRELIEAASARGLRVHTTWGMTETTAQVTTSDANVATQGAGRALPGREVAIEDGEILVRGRTLALGHIEGGRLVSLARDDGFFASGDLGEVDASGCLHVRGRKDRRFVSGGENVSPEEIEAVLCTLEGVRTACVVDVPNATWGARPVAFVTLESDEAVERADPAQRAIPCAREGELRAALRTRLAPAQRPDRIFVLPPSAGLKTDYSSLRRLARSTD